MTDVFFVESDRWERQYRRPKPSAGEAPMAKIEVLVNVPLVGTVKYLDFYPAKEKDGKQYGAQIRLKGTWEGKGDGELYLAAPVLDGLVKQGMAEDAGEKELSGVMVPQFRWLYQGAVQVLKAQEGRTTRTTVLARDDTTPPMARARAIATQAVTQNGDPWKALGNTYAKARQIAVRVWGKDYDPTALVAATATVFIRATSQGMTAEPAPKPSGPPVESFEEMPAALQDEDDDLPW